jgi:RNase P subunit RPR2
MVETFQQQPALRLPVCPNCHLPMRYEASERDKTHSNLRHVMFICSCGLTSDQVVLAPE